MANFVEIGGLKVNEDLYHLVSNEIAPGTGVEPDNFWKALGKIVQDLGPKNRALLDKRNILQKQIDDWCVAQRGRAISANDYKAFLTKVGYLVPKAGLEVYDEVDRKISEVSGRSWSFPR
jgi:malate synthase